MEAAGIAVRYFPLATCQGILLTKAARRSIEQDNRYPTPPSLTLVESRQTQTPVRERRPSPLGCDSPYTAGYTTQNEDWRGPDDVRIRSMRFEIEIENESPRKRAASDSAGLPPPFSKIERGSLSCKR